MASPQGHTLPKIVVTRTPLRVSFAGGGTDLADFYEQDYGAVFSTAIDKYIYVMVKHHSEVNAEPIRVSYSPTELLDNINRLQHNLPPQCFPFSKIDPPIH